MRELTHTFEEIKNKKQTTTNTNTLLVYLLDCKNKNVHTYVQTYIICICRM